MKKTILLVVTCVFACVQMYAQGRLSREEFRAKKQAYISEQAGLTESEAERFFPLYTEMRDKIRKLNNAVSQSEKDLAQGKHSDNEYYQMMERIYNNRIEADRLEKLYFYKFKQFLSGEKIYKIHKAEIDFHRRILKNMVH